LFVKIKFSEFKFGDSINDIQTELQKIFSMIRDNNFQRSSETWRKWWDRYKHRKKIL